MHLLLNTLSGIFTLVALVCWIIVLVRMFQYHRIAPAVASLVLVLCGIGPVVAFVYGWLKADELDIRNVMVVWTVCLLAGLLLGGLALLPRQLGI